MPFLALDDFAAPLQWAAFDAANNPSGLIALAADPDRHPRAVAAGNMRATIGGGAAGHVLRRTFAATDLGGFADLTLWVRADGPAGSNADAPLRLRLALGSAAMPVGAPGNDWHRYLVLPAASRWTYLRFALDDLDPAVRGALTTIELSVAAIDTAQSLWLDGLEAQSPALVGDAETALLALLDGQLAVGGNPVPAVIAPDAPANPGQPHFALELEKSVHNDMRAFNTSLRSDFTDDGYRLRAAPDPWDLYYAIDWGGATATEVAQMRGFLIARFPLSGWLPLGNRAWRVDLVDPLSVVPDAATADGRSYLRISGWSSGGLGSVVRPANDVMLGIEMKASGAGGG